MKISDNVRRLIAEVQKGRQLAREGKERESAKNVYQQRGYDQERLKRFTTDGDWAVNGVTFYDETPNRV